MDDQTHLTMDHVRYALLKSPEGIDLQALVNKLGGYINPEKNVGRVIGAMLGKLSHYDEAVRDDNEDKWYATDRLTLEDPKFSLPEFRVKSSKRTPPSPAPSPEVIAQPEPAQFELAPESAASAVEGNLDIPHVAIVLTKEQHHQEAVVELLIDGIWQEQRLLYPAKLVISANVPNTRPRYPVKDVQTVRVYSWDAQGNVTIHEEEVPYGYYVTFVSIDAR